jgi:hypothetical protein
LKLLQLQKEKGSEWKEQPKTPEQIDRLIDWKLKEADEISQILEILCQTFGICGKTVITDEDKKMIEYLHKNEDIKKKLLNKIDGVQNEK